MIATLRCLSPALRAFGILLTAAVLSAHAASVALSFNQPPAGVITNGTLVPVNVVANTGGAPVVVSATLNFRTWAPLCTNLWNSLSLATNATPTNFVAAIPRLPASNVDYYASCTYVNEDGVTTSTVVSVTNTYTVGTVLASTRNQGFEGGNWTGPSDTTNYNYYSTDGWTGTLMRVAANSALRTTPINASANGAWLRNGSNTLGQTGFLMSPLLPEGAGTLYFEAAIRITTGAYTNNFKAQASADGATWNDLQSFTITGTTVLSNTVPINTRVPSYVRILRAFAPGDPSGNSAVVLDNIRISLPPADLQISQPTNALSPAYPTAGTPVTISCTLQDADTNQATINRRVTLFYTWVSTNGLTNSSSLIMTNLPAIPGQYAATTPLLGTGTNSYYYRCDFDGYYYTNTDKRGPYYLSAGGQTSTNAIPTNLFQYAIAFQNVSIIRLQPLTDLAFGLCATNDTRTRTLLICNDGNTPFTVTNLVFGGSGFLTSFTTNFAVAANNAQSVTVTFAPAAVTGYSDTLQVLSDATFGTNSIPVTGTGMPVEFVSQPTVTGATGGTIGQTLNFSLSPASTDSWGYVAQNSFDWGDGSTSAWGVATSASHSWSAIGLFSVQVYGRSSVNTNVLSATSAPILVTITNNRIMGLSGNLDFGTLGVNAQPLARLLTITNSGNASLNVANITSADPTFTISPTAFDIPPLGASNVTVTFAPTNIENAVTSLITVVSANMTSGVNTTNATGAGEQLTMLSLTPPTSFGTLLPQQLSFLASGTNSSGDPLNYRFNWGDGSTSSWTTASASHGWSGIGPFSVLAQAQCQLHPNALSTWIGPVSVTITNTRAIGLSSSLAFGPVGTNLSANLPLIVTNSGNGPLTVSNISFSNSVFSVSATSLIVPPFGATNVTVTFAPATPGAYSDTVVVVSDAGSGVNTAPVSGFGEMIGKPTISPTNTAGTLLQLISFTAAATNNAGDSLNYRFDWGDGSISGWVGATASHGWTNTGGFSVRAQAQSAIRTNALSVWSDAATLVITNTIYMTLTPPLIAFGNWMTNQTATGTLTVSNGGNGLFHVTGIACPGGFSASPTNFPVATNSSVPVTITFAPTVPGPYSGVVTVTSPDANVGGNTISVTGFCETISAPVLSGLPAGHVNDTLPFGVSATNNAGDSINYRFDWGDGSTSGWTMASATTHVWTATNAYPVRVQAQSASYTNVVSAWSATNLVTIYADPIFTFSQITNGLPFQVTVTATGAAPGTVSNSVFYFSPPGSTNMQPLSLTYVSGNDWTATVPPMNSGVMSYNLQYMRSGVLLGYPAMSNSTLVITNYLGTTRQIGFEAAEGWTWLSPTNDYNYAGPSGWNGTMMNVNVQGALRTTPLNGTPDAMWLRDGTNSLGQMAYIQSPLLLAGVGTVYFEAGIRVTGGAYTADFSVQVSLDYGVTWYTYYTNTVSGTGILYPAVPMNIRQPAIVRIQRTSLDTSSQGANSAIVLDNLIVSPPPTDVQITELLHNPGYPNSKDPVRVRCQTADYPPGNAPSANRRLSVIFRHETDPVGLWTTNSMSNAVVNGVSLYEGVIPVYPQGILTYYFKCDFDGYFYTNNVTTNAPPAPYPSENISPSYLPDQRTGGSGPFPVLARYPVPSTTSLPGIPTYKINIFRTEYGSVALQTTPSSVAIPQMDLVDDYTWQGLVLMQGITNMTWFFVGSQSYSNNAMAFSTNTVSWGDTNQDFVFPPLGGTADVSTNSPLQASLVYNGFLVFRYTTTNQNYLVKRAVYQNFDNWQADQTHFESSLGLYAITTFTNNFSTWGTNFFDPTLRWKIESFQNEPVGNPTYADSDVITYHGWAYQEATPVADRNYQPPLTNNNTALQLRNDSSAQGQVWNTAFGLTTNSLTEGIHNFAFRARLAQNDGRYAVYLGNTNGTAWASGYRVTNTIDAISMSPANPSVSLILCYSGPAYPGDLGSFYELRLAQVSDNSSNDGRLQLALYRWNNGVLNTTPVYGPVTYNGTAAGIQKLTGTPPLQFDISWTNIASVGVAFTGRVTRANTQLFVWSTNACVDQSASRLQYGGTVGFLCSDAEAEISSLGVFAGTNLDIGSRIPMVAYNASTNSSYWYFGRTASLANCWKISGLGNLVRTIPTNTPQVSISMIRTGTSGIRNPEQPYANVASFAVPSFSYNSYSQPLNVWDLTFVMLQYTAGDLPVVVDDLTLDPWRAYTRGYADSNWDNQATANGVQFWNWNSTSQQYTWSLNGTPDENSWLITEGLIVNSAGSGNYASFDASRANPALAQGLWSPILNNGIGSLAYQASVANGTSVYRVEAVSPAGVQIVQTTFTNTVADGLVNGFVAFQLTNAVGRIRIIQLPSVLDANNNWIGGSSPGAILNIDNLVARDFPLPDATTWTAYNCLIARPSTNNLTYNPVAPVSSRAYEPTIFDHQTCYLNNGPTNGTLASEILDASNPYVQTPVISTGIGEIAFWYRAWDTNVAYVSIQVAPSAGTPAGQWTVITNFVATNLTYKYFDLPNVFDTDDQVLRIYTQTNSVLTNNAGRLCIDNILVTEPVRAGYEIIGVTLLPAQPLMTDQVGVQATIGRFLMNPHNIQLYLSYHLGTNLWGYANWRGRNTNVLNTCVTIPMIKTGDTTYSTPGSSNIPAGNIDDVVQFVVWGTFSNIVGRPIFQDTTSFVNPSWYYPVDLNPKNAGGNYLTPTNWSPYYFVYSCPPGSVWINELNYVVMPLQELGNEYVELCGPTNTDISSWRIDVIDPLNNFSLYDQAVVPLDTQIPRWWQPDGNLTTNIWGFWVWGGSYVNLPGPLAQYWDGSEWVTYQTTLPANLLGNDSQNTLLLQNAGLRLVRSMGAYEERLCYGPSAVNAELVAQGYTYIGAKHTLPPWPAPLQLQGIGNKASDFYWYQPSSYNNTPGAPNTDQQLTPLITYYMLYSSIGLHGAQSIGSPPTSPLVAIPIVGGSSTTIVYTADDWYRISSLKSNGSAIPGAVNARQYTWTVSNVSQDISNNAVFYPLPDNLNGYSVPTSWLMGFGHVESDPFGVGPGVHNAYLLNMNPYLSNAFTFVMNAIDNPGPTVSVGVKLLESVNGSAYAPQPSIYGTLFVDATTNLLGAPAWTPVASTQMPPPGVIFNTNGVAPFAIPADTNRFYRGRIQ